MSAEETPGGIAIVGMAGRFPGAADVDAFWQNIKAGVESITFFTDAELVAAGHDPARLREPGFVPARGVITKPDWFDAAFFGMMPIEVDVTDPQQRILLEVAWEALEHAGYDPSGYPGPVGVYAGVGANTYYLNQLSKRPDLLQTVGPMQELIGRDKDFVATRIAFKLNLKGPALSVNTACSTSLVTVCLAVQALQTFQCDLALAGGVSVVLPQEVGYQFEEDGIQSPDGHTRAFDADAQGTIFSSGAGLVVLKRVADALADGDHIYAVIRGAALNNDGAEKASFTAPSADAHAEVIALAHALAGVQAESISYVETHGTGTPIGDPIEIAGLTAAFRATTDAAGFCAIGSVKTNIGHLDVAAGVAGLIKTVRALDDRLLPPSLHYKRPNPKIDFANSPFVVQTELAPWQGPRPLRAGVSSFGVGGTNAHVVLEEAPPAAESDASRPWQLLVLSARTPTALEVATGNLAAWLSERRTVELADVAFTLQVGRHAFPYRRAVLCETGDDLYGAGHRREVIDGHAASGGTRDVVFMFPGAGVETRGVAARLYADEPVFRGAIDRVIETCDPPRRAALAAGFVQADQESEHSIDAPRLIWPVLFATEYAWAELWRSWGVQPAAVFGQDLGEVAAACVAGVMPVGVGTRLVQAFADLAERRGVRELTGLTLEEREVAQILDRARWATTGTRILSNSTGTWLTEADATSPSYWRRSGTAEGLDSALAVLCASKGHVLLEVGPGHQLFDRATERRAGRESARVVSSAGSPGLPDANDRGAMLAALGRLWAAGATVEFGKSWNGQKRKRLPLPTYPFERQRHSITPAPPSRRADQPAGVDAIREVPSTRTVSVAAGALRTGSARDGRS